MPLFVLMAVWTILDCVDERDERDERDVLSEPRTHFDRSARSNLPLAALAGETVAATLVPLLASTVSRGSFVNLMKH